MSILNLFFSCIDQFLIDALVPFVVFRKARQEEVEMIMQSSHTTLFATSTTRVHTTQQNTSSVTLADSGKDEQSGTNMTASILGKAQPSSVVHTSLYDLPSPRSATSIATTLPASPQPIYINKVLYIICNIGHAFI